MYEYIIHKGTGSVTSANGYNYQEEKMNFSSKFMPENLVVSEFIIGTHRLLYNRFSRLIYLKNNQIQYISAKRFIFFWRSFRI